MRSFPPRKPLILSLSVVLLTTLVVEVESSSAAGQETLIGIVGRDFVVLGADSSVSSSISLTSSGVDKIRILVDPFPYGQRKDDENDENDEDARDDRQQQVIAVASAGDAASSERLINHLSSHTSSMEYRYLGCDVKCIYHGEYKGRRESENGTGSGSALPSASTLSPAGLDAESVAYLARGLISSSLRSRGQLKTCLLVAGMVRCSQDIGSSGAIMDIGVVGALNDDGTDTNTNGGNDSSYFAKRIQHQVRAATESYKYSNIQNLINCDQREHQRGDDSNNQELKLAQAQNDKNNATDNATNNDKDKKATVLKPRLFWLDEYGSLQNVEYGAHGLASNFALSILDRRYHPNLSRAAAVDLVVDCFMQLRKRFVINSPTLPCIKCIDAEGCKVMTVSPTRMINDA